MMASSQEERFTFFWTDESPFSQFHPAQFTSVGLFGKDEYEGAKHTFNHAEQWMMFNKAQLFNDEISANKILQTKEPKKCKDLGRRVANFDQNVWNIHNEKIIYQGNYLKFTQNPNLLQKLKETSGTTLVEASPYDRIYGIGLAANNPLAQNRKTWRGRNLLGEVLTKLREDLKKEER